MAAAMGSATRRSWSLEERQRIVDEAQAPGASVAAVARRHGVNANLVFKWIGRAREGWLDRRRAASRGATDVELARGGAAPAFVPVKLVDLSAASTPPPTSPAPTVTQPVHERRDVRRGAMEISLPNGARVSLDADVDAEALCRVLSALGTL